MRGRLAVSSAIALIVLLLTSNAVAGAPPLVTEASIDGDVDLNNRVRYGFQTVEGSEKYNIQYSDVPFTNLSESIYNDQLNPGPQAWIMVSSEPADDPESAETLKFLICWWAQVVLPDSLAGDFQSDPDWKEPTFLVGMPIVPPEAVSVVCDLPGIVRGQEVYIATVSVDANGEFTDDGLEVLSAITLAESAKPPDPDMTSVYIAIGVIVGSLCLTAAVLYFISPSKRERSGYLFILPAILLLATLTFYPVGYGIYLSFTDESAENYGQGEFVGLDNYETLFSDERDYDGDGDPGFWRTFTFTLVWTFGCVAMHMLLGVMFAMLLESGIIGKVAWRTILLIPWAVPGYISVIMWRGMLNRFGWVNGILTSDIDYLGLDNWAKFSVIFVNIWMGFSFMTMTTSGALAGIPKDMYEAANIDGVGRYH